MNYYIQGDAANADQIKEAFKEKGFDADWCPIIRELMYFTVNGRVHLTDSDSIYADIIKTHQDYKELELPVEPNFKVGDKISWINHDCDTQTITDIRDGSYITVDKHGIRCALKFAKQDEWELVPPKHHYDIKNFKPFDKVLVRDSCCEKWAASLFSNYDDKDCIPHHFICIDSCYTQCIPFTEETKHLLGTTDMCDEQYINW